MKTSLVTIEAYQFVAEAELMRATLDQAGIDAYLADDHLIAMDWLMSAAVGGVKLQVAPADVAAAMSLVKEVQDKRRTSAKDDKSGELVQFECENCGLPISFPAFRRGGVESCPECRQYVDVPE